MSDEETRQCIECGETKPIDQFHAWLLNKPRELVCVRCRGWEEDRPLQEQLRERYQSRKAEWEQQREERLRQELETTDEERLYVKQLRTHYQQEAVRAQEWEDLCTQHRGEYMAWAQSLMEGGLTPEEVRRISELVSFVFLDSDWPQIRALLGKLDPPYVKSKPRREVLPQRLRQEIYEQYQGHCFYCGCDVAPQEQPKDVAAAYREVRKSYRAQYRRVQQIAMTAVTHHGWELYYRRREELEASEIGQRYKQLKCMDRETHAQVDHLLPVARGGSNERSNLVLACPDCNLKKSMRTVEEFKAMPNDPVTQLRRYIKDFGSDGRFAEVYELYQIELRGFSVLPPVHGYPLSLLGNIGPDGAWTTDDPDWRRWAYQEWYNYQALLHNWKKRGPRPPSSLRGNNTRIRHLKQMAEQEVREALKRQEGHVAPHM